MTGLSASERAKYTAKAAVAWCLYLVGALHLWKRIALRGRAIVLVYHRVLEPDAADRAWSHPAIVVARRTFERQMRVLARSFNLLSAAQFASIVERGGRFPSASCLVTFDDGWEDTYREAWPVLRRHRIPALVFLPVALVGTQESFWQERMGHLLFAATRRLRQDPSFGAVARQTLAPLALEPAWRGSDDAVRASILGLVQARKRDSKEPAAAIPILANLVGEDVETDGDRLMTWAQAREMAAAGITFGGHGATHRVLTSLGPGALDDEVRQAREVIERELGTRAFSFSYPNGDMDESVADAVRRGGFRLAFSMKRGAAGPDDDPLAIRRINIHEDVTTSTPMFLARILGLF